MTVMSMYLPESFVMIIQDDIIWNSVQILGMITIGYYFTFFISPFNITMVFINLITGKDIEKLGYKLWYNKPSI